MGRWTIMKGFEAWCDRCKAWHSLGGDCPNEIENE